MRREILNHKFGWRVCGCCPGHDKFPDETYDNNRSKRARSRGIANEHRFVRRKIRQNLKNAENEE